jgi:hypothetical protein
MKRWMSWTVCVLGFAAGVQAGDISPYLFGQNHWIAAGDEGSRPGYLHQLWPMVEASGVRLIRIGGNGYNHRLPDRQRLEAMVDSIRHIGAEPLLQVPAGFTALQTMELVECFTRNGERKVRFWSIGNEPLLDGRTTVDQVHATLLRIAPAVKQVDPAARIFVFDECELREPAYQDLCGGRLDVTGLKRNGVWLIDGFTFHKYPFGADFNRDDVVRKGPEIIYRQAYALVLMMEKADRKHHRTGDAKLQWALTEVNVTYANPDREISGFGNPSFLGGQFMAEMFAIGMRFGAFAVAPWCISETDAVATDFGTIGPPREFFPRSSYYHMQMMARNMGGRFLETSSDQSVVKTVGSVDADRICVMVMNEDREKDFEFDLILNREGSSAKALVLHADADLNRRIAGTIPNQTTVLFVFDASGKPIRRITYGLAHNLKNQQPEVKEPE